MAEDDVMVLVHGYLAGGFAGKDKCLSGPGDVKGIQIDPALFVPSDKEVVEDLIVAAIKDGQAKAAQMQREEMGKITEGLNLPEGMKLPF